MFSDKHAVFLYPYFAAAESSSRNHHRDVVVAAYIAVGNIAKKLKNMVTHNASFMLEREREEEFASWLRSEFPQLSEGVIGGLAGLSMSAMREAGGVDYREAEAQTVAFQARFNSIEEARQWSRTRLAGVAARFEEKFGPQAMVYTSIFEDI